MANQTPAAAYFFGSRVLEVRGRSSGEPRRTPVNLLAFEGELRAAAPKHPAFRLTDAAAP